MPIIKGYLKDITKCYDNAENESEELIDDKIIYSFYGIIIDDKNKDYKINARTLIKPEINDLIIMGNYYTERENK
jgi:hypothetical protein